MFLIIIGDHYHCVVHQTTTTTYESAYQTILPMLCLRPLSLHVRHISISDHYLFNAAVCQTKVSIIITGQYITAYNLLSMKHSPIKVSLLAIRKMKKKFSDHLPALQPCIGEGPHLAKGAAVPYKGPAWKTWSCPLTRCRTSLSSPRQWKAGWCLPGGTSTWELISAEPPNTGLYHDYIWTHTEKKTLCPQYYHYVLYFSISDHYYSVMLWSIILQTES
jgi:hypothetical protein